MIVVLLFFYRISSIKLMNIHFWSLIHKRRTLTKKVLQNEQTAKPNHFEALVWQKLARLSFQWRFAPPGLKPLMRAKERTLGIIPNTCTVNDIPCLEWLWTCALFGLGTLEKKESKNNTAQRKFLFVNLTMDSSRVLYADSHGVFGFFTTDQGFEMFLIETLQEAILVYKK